ncbi:MAG: SDR family NAD(P)-dependent oxidoreductase [Gaiella sp.]
MIALVTGGGTGLGAETCRALAAHGCDVAVNYATSVTSAEALVAELGGAGRRAVAIQADVGDEAQAKALVARVQRELGPVDYLVNNAGVTKYGPWGDIDSVSHEDWLRLVRVNLLGAWHCTVAVSHSMRERGAGAVVNVTSDSVFTFDSTSLPYVVTKAALVSLTRTLSLALAPEIRVNAVAPGWMDTPWLERNIPPAVRATRVPADPAEMVPLRDVAEEVWRLLTCGDTGQVMLMLPGEPPRHMPVMPEASGG